MKDKIMICAGILLCIGLFIPLPDLLITVSYVSLFIGSVLIVSLNLYSLKKKIYITYLPEIILYWALLALIVMIASVRNIFATEFYENQNVLLRTFGGDILGENVYIGLSVSIILIVISFIILGKAKSYVMGKIKKLDVNISREEMEYYKKLDGSIRFTSGTAMASIFIYIVVIVGSSLIHFINYQQDIYDVIKENMILSSGITNTILVLLTVCNFSCSYFIIETDKGKR